MSIDLTMNLVDNIIASTFTETKAFVEYCNDLDQLSLITDTEFHLESVEHKNTGIKRTASNIVKNTAKTTKDVGSIYGNVTNAGGSIIKGEWDIFAASLRLITKIISFLAKKISKIPKMIANLIDKIGEIPADIRNKIRGNIKLYITIHDIQDLYAQSLMNQLMTFITLSKTMSEGELWGTFFNKRSNGGIINVGVNDIKISKEMKKIYNYISRLEFKQSVIEMKDASIVDAYFGSSKSVKFIDQNNKRVECTYYEALGRLIKDINDKKDELEAIRIKIGDKIATTQANQQFVQMGSNAQKHITESVQMVAKLIEILGNMVRYIAIDVKTIEDTTNKLLSKKKITADKTVIKKDAKNNSVK